MVSDSIPNPSIALALSNPKDFAKKKRGNRSAKLKQCKRDARREQWLSQGKNKGGGRKEGLIGGGDGGGTVCTENGNDRDVPVKKVEIKPRAAEEIFGKGLSMHHPSDSESSPSNSPTSHNSCFSGGKSEGEEDEDCLDDWEAMADALAADEESQHEDNPSSECDSKLTNEQFCENDISVAKHCHAWRADDAFRPQSLPNLSRMYSAQMNSERHFAPEGPASCPICFDDLDLTDSSFLPCLCGFRLCLFCHKRIIENDGRCPGCRKEYDCEHDNRIL